MKRQPSVAFLRAAILVAFSMYFTLGCPSTSDDDDSVGDDDSSCVRCACGDAGASLAIVSGCAPAWWPDAETCDGGWARLLEEGGLATGDDFCTGSTLENTGIYPCEIQITCE